MKLYLSAVAAFAIFDLAWLGVIIKPFNMQQLSEIGRFQSDGSFDMLLPPAVVVYLLMAAAMSVFVVPTVRAASGPLAAGKGALMGLVVYGVFDMTNLAILKDYPVPFALVDMAWGAVSFALVTLIVRRIDRKLI